MIDPNKTVLMTPRSSLKLYKEGSGVVTIPGSGGQQRLYGSVTIPHGYGSDKLIFQISVEGSGYVAGTILPWQSNDGNPVLYGRLDSNNLYIIGVMDAFGAWPNLNFNFSYRIYIP